MLSRLVIAFHSRTKGLLISWLQSPSAVILELRIIIIIIIIIVIINSLTVSPSICYEVTGLDAITLVL